MRHLELCCGVRSNDLHAVVWMFPVNAEQLRVLQDLSVGARGSLMSPSSAQPIIPDDSNVSIEELRAKYPDDSRWFRRLDNTFRASATPR